MKSFLTIVSCTPVFFQILPVSSAVDQAHFFQYIRELMTLSTGQLTLQWISVGKTNCAIHKTYLIRLIVLSTLGRFSRLVISCVLHKLTALDTDSSTVRLGCQVRKSIWTSLHNVQGVSSAMSVLQSDVFDREVACPRVTTSSDT